MTNKSRFIFLMILSLLAASLIAKNGAVAALALPLLAYLLAGLLAAPGPLHLEASRTLSSTSITPGNPVEVSVRITNQGGNLTNLLLDDSAPVDTTREGSPLQRLALPAGQTACLKYTLQPARGQITWKNLRAVASDPFGLFEKSVDLPAAGEIIVRPPVTRLRSIPLRPRTTLHSAGAVPARLAGSGTDFWGVREYHTGDSLQRLHWRLSARHPQQFFTREFEQEEIIDIGLILDTRIPAGMPDDGIPFLDQCVQAAVSLAEVFLREGNRVGLLIYGQKPILLTPGYGREQLNHILWTLARAGSSGNLSLDYLESMRTRLFSGHVYLVMVSPASVNDLAEYTRLRSYGYQILLVSPDPIHAQPVAAGGHNSPGVRAAHLERQVRLQQLLHLGVHVVDWRVSGSLNEALHTSYQKSIRANGGGDR